MWILEMSYFVAVVEEGGYSPPPIGSPNHTTRILITCKVMVTGPTIMDVLDFSNYFEI